MDTNYVEGVIRDILSHMTISVDSVDFLDGGNGAPTKFTIRTTDSSLLIGTHGAHIAALSILIKRIVSKRLGEAVAAKISLDVNGYQEALASELKNKALIMADRAISFKRDIELDPMSAFERLLVHSALSGKSAIKTESVGQGKERKVVIRYIEPREELKIPTID
jgi:spoIIIJ-associated protein